MFGKQYISKMQVLLNAGDAIKLVDIFGVDVFTQINVRHSETLDFVVKNIQPAFTSADRLAKFKSAIKAKDKEYKSKVKFEFILK